MIPSTGPRLWGWGREGAGRWGKRRGQGLVEGKGERGREIRKGSGTGEWEGGGDRWNWKRESNKGKWEGEGEKGERGERERNRKGKVFK